MDASADQDAEFLESRPVTEVVQGQVFEMRDLAPEEAKTVEEAKAPARHSEAPVAPIRSSALQGQSRQPDTQAVRPQSLPAPLQSGQIIGCAYCQTRLMYPAGAYCVRCPRCSQVTAVQQLRKMMCPYCRTIMMFPTTAKLVQCTCRNTFATIPGVYQVQARS